MHGVDWGAVRDGAPDGLILVRDLLALGVPPSTIAFRCRKVGGSWWRPLLGLVALARGTLTVRQRLVAALLVVGDEAVVTGLAACLGARAGARRGARSPPTREPPLAELEDGIDQRRRHPSHALAGTPREPHNIGAPAVLAKGCPRRSIRPKVPFAQNPGRAIRRSGRPALAADKLLDAVVGHGVAVLLGG